MVGSISRGDHCFALVIAAGFLLLRLSGMVGISN